ncbi:MAG: chemotaxis protein CheB [Chitinophagaceae bacterium]|nr:chemotaxis protein CheB [Chitinophagaceae bacterium]
MAKATVNGDFRVVAMGGSAGSLEVILQAFRELTNTRIATVLVIHRKESLHSALPEMLNTKSHVTVKEAEEKERIMPAHVYIAPADYHLLIEPDGTFSLDYSEKVNFSRPSIDVTFECAAAVFGKKVIGVLLSGGNADGVAGLKAIKKAGGMCVVQNPKSALVSFMPQHAMNELEVDKTLGSGEIGAFLNSIQ